MNELVKRLQEENPDCNVERDIHKLTLACQCEDAVGMDLHKCWTDDCKSCQIRGKFTPIPKKCDPSGDTLCECETTKFLLENGLEINMDSEVSVRWGVYKKDTQANSFRKRTKCRIEKMQFRKFLEKFDELFSTNKE